MKFKLRKDRLLMRSLKESIKSLLGEKLTAKVQNHVLLRKEVHEVEQMLGQEKDISYIDKEFFMEYVNSCKVSDYQYVFSKSGKVPTLYGAVYACMVQSLLNMEPSEKDWCAFFDQYQRADGIFCQKELESPIFEEGENWGARHLAAHMIIPYAKAGKKPPYEFEFLRKYREEDMLIKMLEELDYSHVWGASNKIMNVGVLLQYSRDFLGLDFYDDAICVMEDWLIAHINRETGMWHSYAVKGKGELYEAIRGAYHIYPLLFYDNREVEFAERVIDRILDSQNAWGGFSLLLKSGACEDIDAIDLLLRMSATTSYRREDVKEAVEKSYRWVLCNRGVGGGLMFTYNEPFQYGDCPYLRSGKMEGNLFGTWFRLLCLLYIREALFGEEWILDKVPGYELCIERNGSAI